MSLPVYYALLSFHICAVRPLTVKIIQDLKFMSTKQSYDLRCEVRGSRPAPRISWWLGSSKLTDTKESVGIAGGFFFQSSSSSDFRAHSGTLEKTQLSQFNYFYAHRSANLMATLLLCPPSLAMCATRHSFFALQKPNFSLPRLCTLFESHFH